MLKDKLLKASAIGLTLAAIGAMKAPVANADGPDSVDKAISALGLGLTNRADFAKYFGLSVNPSRIGLCPGEDACVRVPVMKLGLGRDTDPVDEFTVTNPFTGPMEGFVCGDTNTAGIAAGQTVCAESITVRATPTDATSIAAAKDQLNQTVEQAIVGLGIPGVTDRQTLSDFFGINTDATKVWEWQNCPSANFSEPKPGAIEPNCVRIPARTINENSNEPRVFWTDINQRAKGILFDGYKCPAKNPDNGKWLSSRQRQGIGQGKTCAETIVVRKANFLYPNKLGR